MENFKIESRYLKFCYEFKAFIRCIKVAFYRPDYQKFLMCPLIKRLGQAFSSTRTFQTLGRTFEGLREN